MIDLAELDEQGFAVLRDIVDQSTLYNLAYYKQNWDTPVKGHDLNGRYYDHFAEGVKWGNYWTESLIDHWDVKTMNRDLWPLIEPAMPDAVFYHCNVSVVMPGSEKVLPHVDTPYRHQPWNYQIDERLGLQVAMPMQAFSVERGSTAFLPGSHTQAWPIKSCYSGKYTSHFLENCVQPKIAFGDAMVWDARTLHSQMANKTESPRYMLLFNYIRKDIVGELVKYESGL